MLYYCFERLTALTKGLPYRTIIVQGGTTPVSAQARIHTSFHRLAKIGQIFLNKLYFDVKTFQVEI